MKVSIITTVLNSAHTIGDCILSVISQNFNNIEYIVIDGGSNDGTIDIIKKYEDKITRWISEKDNGIYDALNKGIRLATGDIIGFLHSDDLYYDNNVISDVVEVFTDSKVDSCYGDLVYVDRNNTDRLIRYWKAGTYKRSSFKYGWMPPHPTFFCKRDVYEKYGLFNLSFPLAADYELMLRFLYKYEVSTEYIQKVLIKMRVGGTSRPGSYTLKSVIENYRSWKVNGLNYPPTMLLKPFSKIKQYFIKG